jgi:predicted PurR-regulated permease PerM
MSNDKTSNDVATPRSLRWPLLVLAAGILFAVAPFLSGLVGALILFALTRRFHYCLVAFIPPRASALVIAIGTLAVVLVPVAWLVSTIVAEASTGGGIASNVDNVVRLVVYRRVSGIHPTVALVGVFAGVRMFGLVGAFIAPLVLSCFVELLSVYDEARTGMRARAALAQRPG